MIGDKKVLALIPARGGSKGIKDKNIVDIEGKPLIAYTIEASVSSRYVDRTVVSTDSEKIRDAALQFGADVPFLRPAYLAEDKSTTLDVVLHGIETLADMGEKYDILILLQPTSPLRTQADIDGAIEKFYRYECRPLVAVSAVSDSPVLIRRIIDDTHMTKLFATSSTIRRQDMPEYYRVNGSIYINKIEDIHKETSFNDNEVPYIMESSHSVDVDEYQDLEVVKYYMKRRREKDNGVL